MISIQNSAVIAGLDPAIHHLREILFAKKMDARVKPGQDDRWVSLILAPMGSSPRVTDVGCCG
jgi:hypothetical protein